MRHGRTAQGRNGRIRDLAAYAASRLLDVLLVRAFCVVPPAGQLVECTPALCPYATWTNVTTDPPGSPPRLINRVGYSGNVASLGQINVNIASIYKTAV